MSLHDEQSAQQNIQQIFSSIESSQEPPPPTPTIFIGDFLDDKAVFEDWFNEAMITFQVILKVVYDKLGRMFKLLVQRRFLNGEDTEIERRQKKITKKSCRGRQMLTQTQSVVNFDKNQTAGNKYFVKKTMFQSFILTI